MKVNKNYPHDYQWYNNNGTKNEFNTFLKIQYALNENLSLYGDVQYRQISYKMTGPDDDLISLDQDNDYNFVNPKFGINYVLNSSNKFYATFGLANREPSRTDLKEGIKTYDKKVPTYETLYDYEAGYKITKSKYAIGLNLYYMDYKNQLVNTGELNSVGNPIMTNVDKSYRTGIEFMFGLKPLKNLEWKGNLTLSKNIIKDFVDYDKHVDTAGNKYYKGVELGDVNISFSPEVISSSMISYKFAKFFTFNLISKYVSKQYIDNTMNEDRKIDGYFVNNIRLDFEKQFKNAPALNLQFLVNNIFDVDYITNANGGKWYETDGTQEIEKSWVNYYPAAGINFMFKLSLMF
jgi:iron complex outermembrane receptor protein